MQIQVQLKRRRKGISVSLTPNKHNNNNNAQRPASPAPQQILLKQSFASIQQQPIYPKYVRIFSSYRAPDAPSVRFTYSNVSKDQEVREGMILDQQINALKQQIGNKRQIIHNLQRQQNQLAISNVRPGYSYPQPHQTVYPQPIQKMVKISAATGNIAHSFVPQHQIKDITMHDFDHNGGVNALNHNQLQNIRSSTNQYKINQKHILQSQAELKPQQNIQKSDVKVQNPNIIDKNLALNSTIKKECRKQQSPPKVASKASKQNKKKIDDRIEKLKWAEQKLLDIIKICDTGL